MKCSTIIPATTLTAFLWLSLETTQAFVPRPRFNPSVSLSQHQSSPIIAPTGISPIGSFRTVVASSSASLQLLRNSVIPTTISPCDKVIGASSSTTSMKLLKNSTTLDDSPLSNSDSSSSSSSTAAEAAATTSSESSGTRWTESSRWEGAGEDGQEQFLLREKYGKYFRVPSPAKLMSKIVCTIGPATRSPTMLGRLLDAGMSAARINMSHSSDYEDLGELIKTIREVAKARNKLCPIILDTKGPEIRINWLKCDNNKNDREEDNNNTKKGCSVFWKSGDDVILWTGAYAEDPSPLNDKNNNNKDKKQAAVTYPYLASAVNTGDVILLDDGRISLIVTKIPNEEQVYAKVIEGGTLVNNKGVNLPGCYVDLPHLTPKDEQDILFGVSHNVEYIAHSFTRSATGINQVRELPGVVESGCHIIAKIESQEGLDHFASILRVSDGVMVARGDLGVEIPLERVCSVQKRLVASCNAVGKPVIVATELLDSMIHHPRPTRAEASDVANAVFDGADCVMLSGETAIGKYPVESIQVMSRICKEAEMDVASSLRAMAAGDNEFGFTYHHHHHHHHHREADGLLSSGSISNLNTSPVLRGGEGGALRDAFAKSAIVAARETNAELIITLSRTGQTANALAKFFSSVPVMVLSTSPQVCAQVLLHRSVTPYLVDSLQRESCVPRAIAKATELGLVGPGSRVLLLTGKDDMIANRLETFVVGEEVIAPSLPPLTSTNSFKDSDLSP